MKEYLFYSTVKRMVKYTGYGNSAGLLAELGLLKPSGGMQANTSCYSSDSGDSDTEEYLDLIDKYVFSLMLTLLFYLICSTFFY